MRKIASIIFNILLVCGCIYALLCGEVRSHDNPNYAELQPESFVPDVIETVLHDKELKQIYVCYNDANCVNVYAESGEFLWAVATPEIRNSYFELQDDKLLIYGHDDAYIYNSKNGEFLGIENADDLNLNYYWQNEQAGEFSFDFYQVYRASPDGTLNIVVSRPWWHWIFNSAVPFILIFSAFFVTGAILFIEKRKAYNSVKNKVTFRAPKSKTIVNYSKVTSIIHLVYTFLNIVFGFFGGILCIGIIPIAIHFIVSGVILSRMSKKIHVSKEEETVIDYWNAFALDTFIIVFFSVITVAVIAV